MMKRIFVFSGLLLISFSVFSKTMILRDAHVTNLTNESRVTFSLSATTQYRSFVLHHPNRFIIDLQNVKTRKRLHLLLSNLLVKTFRYATHRDGVLRMVFVLCDNAHAKAVVLPATAKREARLKIVFYAGNHVIEDTAESVDSSATHVPVITDTEDSNQHRDVIIVIDPGHGGKDPGATGLGGTKEKNVVLAISKKLQKLIDQQKGYHALLTRTGDYYLTLRQRLAIARKDKADMFIAIHADKWKNATARGVSVFALSQRGATSEAARWLAARENASELIGGVDLNDKSHLLKSVLINLSQAATIRSSLQIGDDIIQQVKSIARLHHPCVEQAAFVVLKSPDIPSLLVETGFLSNPKEERRLKKNRYQMELATALDRGICDYFSHNSPRNTWLSYWRHHSGLQGA